MKSTITGALGAPTMEDQPRPASAPATETAGTSGRRFSWSHPASSLHIKQALSSINVPSLFASSGGSSGDHTPPNNSIAPMSHRENTPLHALRDTMLANNIIPGKRAAALEGFADLEGPVILLGGYRGSVLRDARTNRRLWAPVKAALRLRTADLTLGLTDADELMSTETVVAEKALTTVGGFVQMGKNLKDRLVALEKEGRITFHSFGYDWRRNLDLSSAELYGLSVKMHRESGKGVTIISHSMGGLVALHAVATARDPRIFSRVLFAGTPFEGCPNALGPLRHGDSLGLNEAICSPKAVFSMRSTFYFLNELNNHVFETEDGKPIRMDFFSMHDWSHFGFSPVTLHLHQPESQARHLALRDAETASFLDDSAALAATSGSPLPGAAAADEDDEIDETGSLPTAPSMSVINKRPSMTSLVAPPSDTPPRDDSLIADYLERTLDRVQRFRRETIEGYDPAKAHLYPSFGLIVSRTTPTVRGARVSDEQGVIAGDFSKLLYDHGDGIVLYSSCTILPGQWGKHVKSIEHTNFGHVSLLSDLGAVGRALSKTQADTV